MTTPVKVFGDYVVCFEAEPEDVGMRHHFVKECGWTDAQYRKIKDCAWFSAKVAIWRNGKELATDYLGCCSYTTEEEFWTRYEGDYFADMVHECASEIQDPVLILAVNTWRNKFREEIAA